jgi:hypothetical protein
VRIIIDIDGEDVTVRTERTSTTTASHREERPPELLRTAAALGAMSAGPAPAEAASAATEASLEVNDAGSARIATPMPTDGEREGDQSQP